MENGLLKECTSVSVGGECNAYRQPLGDLAESGQSQKACKVRSLELRDAKVKYMQGLCKRYKLRLNV